MRYAAAMERAEPAVDRRRFRLHPLDGAALYFQPATGVHVRVAVAATAPLRRLAPRVAMFGVTNACNLACAFCSRDVARPSAWTVATAVAALRGLHDAGTLEVAYGGGEPFAFRGFDELVAELDRTTALAQHVTTNGTLIRPTTWPRFAGRFGQVRLSLYDGVDWRAPADTLAAHDQRWGANIIVDAAALPGLPALLHELAARGCHDVSLLSYVGPDPDRHLDPAGARSLAAIVGDSPLACRLSVCFGDRVPVPLLRVGDEPGDCGAGRDFVSITPDRRVQSCSFHDRSLPGATADEILRAWRLQRALLAAPATRRGCARALPTVAAPPAPPPIAIWRGFSGNNSGECVMVATFRAVDDAEAYLAELAPGFEPGGDDSPQWRRLFVDEGVLAAGADPRGRAAPHELLALGSTVLASQYDADDPFPELRALAWKRGAFVVPGGVHVHHGLTLLVAVLLRCAGHRERLLAAPRPPGMRAYPHGDVVFLTLPVALHAHPSSALHAARDEVLRLAGGHRLAAELFTDEFSEADLLAVKRQLGHRPPATPRLWTSFPPFDSDDSAIAFARHMPAGRTIRAGSAVLVDPAPDRKRLAVLAYRHGGHAHALDGHRVTLRATLWHPPPPVRRVDRDQLDAALRARLPAGAELGVELPESHGPRTYYPGPFVTAVTDAPATVLTALADEAALRDARVTAWAADRDPLGAALHRLLAALGR